MSDQTYRDVVHLVIPRMVAAFYLELVRQGVPRTHALAMTCTWMRLTLRIPPSE